MRKSIAKIATTALAAPVVGALLLTGAPASAAASSAPAAAPAVKAEPYNRFTVSVKYPRKVRKGGAITYVIRAVNHGPYAADYYWLGGKLPKGTTGTVYYTGPKGTKCDFDSDGFWCYPPKVLEVGDQDFLILKVKLKRGTTGTATARLGAFSADVPTGAETLDKDLLLELGIKTHYWWKTVKTKITR
ncbi:hypothetical protein AB0K60_26970 [Thermopolyspora sp. NPDC052614]|uniref:hypothetical protein n=1 Tax=Thermopolyspora sp. NPDC052614 TaxID=3155682 RepID=UPI00341F97C5